MDGSKHRKPSLETPPSLGPHPAPDRQPEAIALAPRRSALARAVGTFYDLNQTGHGSSSLDPGGA